MTGHVHAEAMALYAEDAKETEKPWERWQARTIDPSNKYWRDITSHPNWSDHTEYRRRPNVCVQFLDGNWVVLLDTKCIALLDKRPTPSLTTAIVEECLSSTIK